MSRGGCVRETEVVRALIADAWPEGLADHARGCRACGETARVAAWLQGVARAAEAAESGAPLPRTGEIWARGRIERRVEGRRHLVHRALRPVLVFERVGALAGAAAAALAVAWTWDALGGAPAGSPPGWEWAAGLASGTGPLGAAAAAAAAIFALGVALVAFLAAEIDRA